MTPLQKLLAKAGEAQVSKNYTKQAELERRAGNKVVRTARHCGSAVEVEDELRRVLDIARNTVAALELAVDWAREAQEDPDE